MLTERQAGGCMCERLMDAISRIAHLECGADPEERFEKALDAYAENPDADMFQALFGGIDMKTPKLPVEPLRKLPEEVTGQSMCDAG